MTTLLNATFENGTAGAAITPGNSPFTNGLSPAGWTYSSSPVLSPGGGTRAARSEATGLAGGVYAFAPVTPGDVFYVGAYIYATAAPPANTTVAQLLSSTGVVAAELQVTATGTLRIRRTGDLVTIATSPAGTLPLNTWCRVEWRYDAVALRQELRAFAGANANTTTPTYQSGEVVTTAGPEVTQLNIGIISPTSAVWTLHWDNVKVDDATWPGPAVTAVNQAPTVTASANLTNISPGATVTHTATASDPDGAIASMVWVPPAGVTGVTQNRVGNTSTLTYTAPSASTASTLTSRINVTDEDGLTATDTVTAGILAAASTGGLLSEEFEGGANGVAITSANSTFTTVGAGWTFSTAQLLTIGGGNRSGRMDAVGTAAVIASDDFAATSTPFVRWYFYNDTPPTAFAVIAMLGAGTTTRAELRLGADGALQMRNSLLAGIHTTPAGVVPQDAWCRIEWHYDNVDGTQELRVFSGTRLHSTIPSYTSPAAATGNAGTVTRASFGGITGTAVMRSLWDNLKVDQTTWIGPSVTAQPPPVANAGLDQTVDPNIEATVELSAVGSTSEGTIESYVWADTTGQATALGSGIVFDAPIARDPNGTVRTIRLTVTDDLGQTSVDFCTITSLPHTHWMMTATGLRAVRRVRPTVQALQLQVVDNDNGTSTVTGSAAVDQNNGTTEIAAVAGVVENDNGTTTLP